MGKLAVDVVLLPDEAMMQKVIAANKKLVEKFDSEIVLDKDGCLPHISLAMGVLEEGDVGTVEGILRSVAEQTSLGKLEAVGVRTSVNAKGQKVSVFEVKKTRQLQQLHEQIMVRLASSFDHNVTSEMLYGAGEVAESTLTWIADYPDKASFENFFPHITVGFGEAEGQGFPLEFSVSRLALCQLGNHCTCRKVLVAVDMGRV